MVTTATNPAISRSPMNYPAWRPTGNTRIIPIHNTRTQDPVHIQAQARGTPGQATRHIPWQTRQACRQLEDQELEADLRTVTASKPTLVTQEMAEEMGVEMGAQHPHKQRNHSEEAKCPHRIPVSTCRVPGATVITWAQEPIQPNI